jgi:hypothetical protein
MPESNEWQVVVKKKADTAFIENEYGDVLAAVRRQRMTKTINDGDPVQYYACDWRWQSIVDLIAAAPEMLTVLREVDRHFHCPNELSYEGLQGLRNAVTAVLAKAEPPRKVTKRLLVTVEVEVEADSDATLDVFKTRALDSVYTGGGVCVSFKGKTVTTLGELYEE